jgi:LysM repeat protein
MMSKGGNGMDQPPARGAAGSASVAARGLIPRIARSLTITVVAAAVGAGFVARIAELTGPPPARSIDQLVELTVLAVGALVAGWFAVSSIVAAGCLVARGLGRAWQGGERLIAQLAPSIVRRTLTVTVAAGIGISTAVGAGAAPVGAAVSVAGGALTAVSTSDDLGWPVSSPTPGPEAAGAPSVAAPAPQPARAASATTAPSSPGSPTAAPGTASPSTVPTAGPTASSPAGPDTAEPAADPPTAPSGAAPSPTPAAAPAEPEPAGAAPPPGSTGASRSTTSTTVVVRAGDTLWGIARRSLPVDATDEQVAAAWPAWYRANQATIGPDPDLIRPGQVLLAPQEPA